MKWFQQIMYGRYGIDKLNKILAGMIIFLFLVNLFFPSATIYALALILLTLLYFRTFSKNHQKRFQENQNFLRYWNPLERNVHIRIKQLKELRTHRYFKCKKCGQFIRIPRKKGQVEISCPKCHHKFPGRT